MFLTTIPRIHSCAFLARSAEIIGDVQIGEDASIWYQVVIRADIQRVVIGKGTNVQDGTIIHLSSSTGVHVGDYVTIGHRAIVHAATIDDEVLIGMGAIVMDDTEVGKHSIIGAGALVTKGQKIPPGSLVMGSPARVVRALSKEEQLGIRRTAEKYIHVARFHRERAESASIT